MYDINDVEPWITPPDFLPEDATGEDLDAMWFEWAESDFCRCPDVRHGWQGCKAARDLGRRRTRGIYPVCDPCAGGDCARR